MAQDRHEHDLRGSHHGHTVRGSQDFRDYCEFRGVPRSLAPTVFADKPSPADVEREGEAKAAAHALLYPSSDHISAATKTKPVKLSSSSCLGFLSRFCGKTQEPPATEPELTTTSRIGDDWSVKAGNACAC